MTQQHTPTLKPIKPGLYYLDYTDCAKINAHDDLAAALKRCISALAAYEAPNCEAVKEARAALAKAKASA